MENIIEPSNTFDFSQLNLENPAPLQGGNFFTKINYTDRKLPLYLQLPKCKTKHGILKNTTTKKTHTDLLFNYYESDLIEWFENLESKCRELLFAKKDIWFQTEMSLDDIENMFISPIKSYKSGKFFIIRAHIPCTKQIKKDYCMIYDENERILDISSILDTTELIPLVCIDGIKFSSKSFQIDINLPQLMILSVQNEIKNDFLIKVTKQSTITDCLEETKESEETKELEETKEIITNSLEEVQLHIDNIDDSVSLKKPSEVYYEIYKAAREKAKHIKKAAIEAYLEAKNIKTLYMLDDINESDDESNISENEEKPI